MIRIRITADEDEIKVFALLLKKYYKVVNEPVLYDTTIDIRKKTSYFDVAAEDTDVKVSLQEYQIIDYCNKWRSKNDVKHEFGVSFEAAAEILDRLAESGALYKLVTNKKYEYVDARYLQFVVRECGNCEHRGAWGDCYKGVKPEDLGEAVEYIPVHHAACEKFKPSYFGVLEVLTKENYDNINEGGA